MNGRQPDPDESRNDTRFDLPEFPGPTFSGTATDYVICALPRSGSTLLAFLLGACGLMGVPREYFEPGYSQVLARHLGLLARAILRMSKPISLACANGVFGIKVQYGQLRTRLGDETIEKLIEDARLIRLRRRDRLGQAISYYTAGATGIWHSFDDEPAAPRIPEYAATPEYNGPEIAQRLKDIVADEEGYRSLFAAKELSALDVWYEDLIADPDTVCRAICAYVGTAPVHRFELAQSGVRKLISAHTEEWKRRFRAEHPEWVSRGALGR